MVVSFIVGIFVSIIWLIHRCVVCCLTPPQMKLTQDQFIIIGWASDSFLLLLHLSMAQAASIDVGVVVV